MEKANFENKIKRNIESYPLKLKPIESDVIEFLSKLLNLFYSVINSEAQSYQNEELRKLFSDNKLKIINLLKDKGYQPNEFKILKTEDFQDHLQYLQELLKNLNYYLSKYEFNGICINLYYYLFHLIYFLLLAITEEKDKLLLKEDTIKFYMHHIVHFFKKDERTPENHYFFYHGAFKHLKKIYNIKTDYVINFNHDKIDFRIPFTIQKILRDFKTRNISSTNVNELDFVGTFSAFMNKVQNYFNEIMDKYEQLNPNNTDEFINFITIISDKIGNIEIDLNQLTCQELTNYKSLIDNFKKLISERRMNLNDLILMDLNYLHYPEKKKKYKYDILEYIEYANFFNACDKDSDEDYTDIFKNILNSNKFKSLYLMAMKSKPIRDFVSDFSLDDLYNNFMKNYSEKINEYIIFAPLTRGIKAYVSNYLRIVLNINSVKILGEFDENSKNDFLISYLLIQMLQESFHFLFRLNKIGQNSSKGISPKREKIKEDYGDIGVDLILYIFGTEYIPYISKMNSILICDPKSWENPNTNFKVFNKVYLCQYQLINENDKENNTDSGLKYNISSGYEFYPIHDFKICTDDTIRYCF